MALPGVFRPVPQALFDSRMIQTVAYCSSNYRDLKCQSRAMRFGMAPDDYRDKDGELSRKHGIPSLARFGVITV